MIIKIKNLKATTIIGVYDFEKNINRELTINIELQIDATKAAQTDDINDTLDYDALSQMVIKETAASHYHLLEKLAAHLLDRIMENQIIQRTRIEIDKGGVVKHVESVSIVDERIRS